MHLHRPIRKAKFEALSDLDALSLPDLIERILPREKVTSTISNFVILYRL